MKYLLDTNAAIGLLNNRHSPVAHQVRRHAPQDVAISAIVVHELYYGAFKSQRMEWSVARIDSLELEILDFDHDDARQAGEVRALLAASGNPIGPYDVLIAGQARARALTLVTHNVAEFSRVPRLHLVDWNESAAANADEARRG